MTVTSARFSIDDAAVLAAVCGHTAEVLEYGTSGSPQCFKACAYASETCRKESIPSSCTVAQHTRRSGAVYITLEAQKVQKQARDS